MQGQHLSGVLGGSNNAQNTRGYSPQKPKWNPSNQNRKTYKINN